MILRTIDGRRAYTQWLKIDGSVTTLHVPQADYDTWIAEGSRAGVEPGKPAADSIFLGGAGGCYAFDGGNPPNLGDYWVEPFTVNGVPAQRIRVCVDGIGADWEASLSIADRPVGGESNLTTRTAYSRGAQLVLPASTVLAGVDLEFTDIVSVPRIRNGKLQIPIAGRSSGCDVTTSKMSNHKSVSFDAKAQNSTNSATSLTVSHTMSAQAGGYISAAYIYANTTLSGITQAASALNLQAEVSNGFNVRFGDKNPPPATGAQSVIGTIADLSAIVGLVVSAYGGDSVTPRSSYTTATGVSASATVTTGTAAGEMAISYFGYDYNANPTLDTGGNGWTLGNNLINTNADVRLASMYKLIASGSTIARTDTLTSAEWIAISLSVKAAAVGGRTTKNTRSNPLGLGAGMSRGLIIR